MKYKLSFFDILSIFIGFKTNPFNCIHENIILKLLNNKDNIINISQGKHQIYFKLKSGYTLGVWTSNKWYAFAHYITIHDKNLNLLFETVSEGRPSKKTIYLLAKYIYSQMDKICIMNDKYNINLDKLFSKDCGE